ncbi:unnamed protein product [Parnassius apollo]|uniref:(apollo) hypothetical protein n=1 Tax=Parnassius apollo TaxID=110799 RepID=A0A8S3XNE1_PARAO|nr:unnamed protein product [Parnassius apollo]
MEDLDMPIPTPVTSALRSPHAACPPRTTGPPGIVLTPYTRNKCRVENCVRSHTVLSTIIEVLKRTADQIAAKGNDIPNIEILVRHLKERCPGVIIEVVYESGILEKDMLIPENLKEFRGTMRTHQVVWSANQLQTLAMRELSCNLDKCSQEAIQCSHGQHIGFYTIEDINKQQSHHSVVLNVKSADKRKVTSKKSTCSSLIQRSQISATEIQTGKDTDITQQDLDLPEYDSFWMETSSIDERLITPKFTRDVLSTLHQKSVGDRSDSDDEDIFVFKKPQYDKRTKESHGIVEDMIIPSSSENSRSRQQEKGFMDDIESSSVPSPKPRKYFF